MKKPKWLFVGFVLLFIVSCQQTEVFTPTPFQPTPEDLSIAAGGSSITPVPAFLTDIMANPEFYEDAHVLVTGQYYRRPLQICGVDAHSSPVGWDLVAGDVSVPAGGFNSQLRQLMPDGITMTVIGRFSYWKGPVGCGKQAVSTQMWYLDVVKIIDPAQLVQVTLTPGSGGSLDNGEFSDQLFTPVSTPNAATPEGNANVPTSPPVAPPTNTVQPTRVVPIETLGAGFTPVSSDDVNVETPTTTGTPGASETAVSSATASGTVTSISTPTPGRGISTVTNTPPPGASSTPVAVPTSDSNVVRKGMGFANTDFEVQELSSSETHEWLVEMDDGDEWVFAVIGEPTMDVGLTILDNDLVVLEDLDETGVGEAESLAFEFPDQGIYRIHVSSLNEESGSYILLMGFPEYPPIVQGLLPLGEDVSKILDSDELHYWYFEGVQGDTIDLTLACTPSLDLGGIIYDADGLDIDEFYSEDVLTDVFLPVTGFYVIEMENWDLAGGSCNYTLNVTK